MFTEFFNDVYKMIASLSLETLLCVCWGAFAFIFLLTLVLTLWNAGVRAADKRPYAAAVNVFAALTFAFSLMWEELAFSVLLAAAFWCVGYISYGVIVLASRRAVNKRPPVPMPQQPQPPSNMLRPEITPAKTNVRTEHAVGLAQKLLEKELGRGDRQEAEKILSSLRFMQAKGELTPEDNESLNENFNALLKLMAKYSV